MLIQPFSRAQTEGEAAVAEQRHGGRCLRNDCGVVAHDRTGHRRHQRHAPRGICQRSQHRPRKRRVPLLLQPREEMVGNRRKVEARLLGTRRIADERERSMLLGHELVAELEHRSFPC